MVPVKESPRRHLKSDRGSTSETRRTSAQPPSAVSRGTPPQVWALGLAAKRGGPVSHLKGPCPLKQKFEREALRTRPRLTALQLPRLTVVSNATGTRTGVGPGSAPGNSCTFPPSCTTVPPVAVDRSPPWLAISTLVDRPGASRASGVAAGSVGLGGGGTGLGDAVGLLARSTADADCTDHDIVTHERDATGNSRRRRCWWCGCRRTVASAGRSR